MTIRDRDAYNRSSPDWAMLAGCFGNGDGVMDVDGDKERGGAFFRLEHKLPAGRVSRAQDIAFDAHRNLGTLLPSGKYVQRSVAVVFWCALSDGSDIDRIQVYYPPGPGYVRFPEPKPGTLAALRDVASWWYINCPAPKRRYI